MQDKVIKAIRNFKKPESLTDLQSFQGMANQLAPFNRDLATALQPFRSLLQKNAQPFHMNDEQILSFENAKAILTSNNVIAYYRPGAPLRLFTDASLKYGLGFYLKQQQTDNDWKTIHAGSRTLTPSETRYACIELELQAIVYATKICRNFLAGTKFNLFTDHRPLVSICNKRRLDNINNSRILRSLLKLIDYNFTVNQVLKIKLQIHFLATLLITLTKLTNSMQIHRHSFFEFAIYPKLKWQIFVSHRTA